MIKSLVVCCCVIAAAICSAQTVQSIAFDQTKYAGGGAFVNATVTLSGPVEAPIGKFYGVAHSALLQSEMVPATEGFAAQGADSFVLTYQVKRAIAADTTLFITVTDPETNIFLTGMTLGRPMFAKATFIDGQLCVAGASVEVHVKLNGVPTNWNPIITLTSSDPGVTFSDGGTVMVRDGDREAIAVMTFPADALPESQITCTMPANDLQFVSQPFWVHSLAVKSLTYTDNPVSGGTSSSFTLTMNAASLTDTVINLSSGPYITVPSTITIPAGSTSVIVGFSTKATVRSRIESVLVTLGSSSRSYPITISP